MSRTETRIGLLHHVGGGNLGDEATLETIASNIKQRSPIAEIVAFSMNPDDTEARHGIKSYPLRRKRWGIGYRPVETKATFKEGMKALARKHKAIFYLLAMVRLPSEAFRELSFLVSSRRKVKSLDLLIISGGGQLTGRDGPWGFPYTILKWIVLARSAGVRCIFLNVGAGPLSHPLAKFFARRALFSAEYVSLRDNKSQALVREIGFTGESRVFPDSVYSLESAATNANPPEQGSRPIVGFAPMPYPDQGAPTERDQILYNAFIAKLAGFGSWLASQSYALTLFGTDIGVDPQAIKDLQKTLQDQEVICSPQYGISYPVESVRDLLATMSGLDYVVTCRFHGVVFAHLLNKPVLAIAHHPKVAELMSDLELSAYCVDIQDFDPNLLAERFALMVVQTEEIKARMAARLTGNRQLLRRQFDELFQL